MASGEQTTPEKGEVWSPHPISRAKPRVILAGTRGDSVWSAPVRQDGKPALGGQCWSLGAWLAWVSKHKAERVG